MKNPKYLKYAFGEIVLVVIGILIALSINNLNKNRIDKLEEKRIIQNLLIELDLELENLDNHVRDQRVYQAGSRYILDHYNTNNGFKVNKELIRRINDMMVRNGYVNVNATFETLKNTGKLDLISDEALKNQVVITYQSLFGFADNTQNNNARLVDQLVDRSLLNITVFQPQFFTGDMQRVFNVTDADEEHKETDRMMKILQRKLQSEDIQFELINLVNFRAFLSNIQIDFVRIEKEKVNALVHSLKANLKELE